MTSRSGDGDVAQPGDQSATLAGSETIAAVSNDHALINQAHYDAAQRLLVITVSGGKATTDPCEISVANLDGDTDYTVMYGDEVYRDWTRAAESLVIRTHPLGSGEESFVVRAGRVGCACTAGDSGPAVMPWLFALALLVKWGKRGRC